MSWLVVVPLFITPADTPSAAAHEKALAPRLEQLADANIQKSVWRVEPSGATHWQSTMVCPAKVRGLVRDKLVPFDGYGFDVGCNFSSSSGEVSVTLYLTRRRPVAG